VHSIKQTAKRLRLLAPFETTFFEVILGPVVNMNVVAEAFQ
jgi:hypothetical protein